MSGSNRISRRNFLFVAGASGAAAAAALVVANKDGASLQPKKGKTPPAGNGYRLSEHVRNYYRTTKV